MPVDFKQIAEGEDFELLCADLLRAMGFTILHPPARGQEGGKDLIVSETVTDRIGFAEERKTLVQCKHKAHGGRAVGFGEVNNYRDVMDQYAVRRYLLITSTVPTEDLRDKFEKTTRKGDFVASIWSKNDLTRLLDAHPDVRARHFPPEPEPEPTPAAALAAIVQGPLACLGFTCQAPEQLDPLRVSILCQGSKPFAQRMLVVCKEGTVERPDVEDLKAQLQARDLDRGVLVTHTRVSPAARDAAADTGDLVRAFTLDEFYRELIDFEPYVRALIADYEGSELATYYVDLGCRTADGSEIKPMDGYVDRWLNDPARNHISILGDYGTGKTSFCRQYAAELGRRWLADPDRNRIPVLISLREYAKTMGLQQLVTDFLVNRCDIQAKYEAFTRFNADGKLVLLFDGFDEMAQKVDYQTTVDNFEELARAVEDQSKVLLTCRTPYFRTREEAERLLHTLAPLPESSQRPQRSPLSGRWLDRPAIDLSSRPNFEIVHLLPFTDTDIQIILQKRALDQWEDYWRQIQHTYNLPELAQRPVLLDMIACSLPQLEPGQAINAARLYELYTDLWLTRDWEKGRTLITRDDKRLFMQELALEMHRRGELSLHYSRLPERVQEYFHLEKKTEIDYFDYDVRTCTFLNRDPEGNYHFLHRSFGEFFVAQWLAPRLLDGSAPEMAINEEIRGFVHGLLAGADWPPEPPEGAEVPEGMVWVPKGPFIMGGRYGVDVQVARVDHSFFIARTPVTNAEYARFVEATGHKSPEHWGGQVPPDELRDHPVVYVSWDDAAAYAAWAGGRLPAEEEWEKAARGIDGRIYPWGDGFDPVRCNSWESGIGTTTPVGRYSPGGDSGCGCTDAAGNVLEWAASESTPGSGRRVLRGGAFFSGETVVRCAFRDRSAPGSRGDYYGFRLCLVSQQD